jgi:hypothetical protein
MDALPKSIGNINALTLNSFFDVYQHGQPVSPYNKRQQTTFTLSKAFSLEEPDKNVPFNPDKNGQNYITIAVVQVQGNKLPTIELAQLGGTLERMLPNPAYDEVSTFLRETKTWVQKERPHLLEKKYPFAGHTLAFWEAAAVLRYGRVTMSNEKLRIKSEPLRLHILAAAEQLEHMPLMEALLLTIHGEIKNSIWHTVVPELQKENGYTPAALAHILAEGIAPEDAKSFIGIPEVWLDELFED